MNCREFSEIADSYLSDELLVETNHELLRHMESCAACRGLLADRRELRDRLRSAVRNSAAMDAGFGASVRAGIRGRAGRRTSLILVPVFGLSVVLLSALLGVAVYLQFPDRASDSARFDLEDAVRRSGLMAALHDALGNHKFCGIKFGKNPAKEIVEDREFASLKESVSGELEFVEKHDCIYKDRIYTHTILRRGTRLISILRTKSESEGDTGTIVSVPVEQLQIAEFEADGITVFVISDLTEIENLQIARVVSKRQGI